MSEKEKRSEILQEQIDKLQKEIEELKKKPAESSKTSTELINLHTHTPKEIFDCPTCGEPYLTEAKKRLQPEFEKAQREKFKVMERPAICEDCGEIVDKEKAEECPSCHGHNY